MRIWKEKSGKSGNLNFRTKGPSIITALTRRNNKDWNKIVGRRRYVVEQAVQYVYGTWYQYTVRYAQCWSMDPLIAVKKRILL